jgi:peptidoglycan hydrolase-like protein with peptidoglycan-binding domain
MTPWHARVALGLFCLLAAGVAVNALYLQDRYPVAAMSAGSREHAPVETSSIAPAPARGPAAADKPKTSHRPAAPHRDRVGRMQPNAATAAPLPDVAGTSGASTDLVRSVQRELEQRGYGPLNNDGLLRIPTRAAIMAFEYDHGLPLTGEASDALLARVLLGAASTADVPGARNIQSPAAEQVARSVQQSLASLGYAIARVDGSVGGETAKAIREFEVDHGLVPTGRISAGLVLRLTEAVAQAKMSAQR